MAEEVDRGRAFLKSYHQWQVEEKQAAKKTGGGQQKLSPSSGQPKPKPTNGGSAQPAAPLIPKAPPAPQFLDQYREYEKKMAKELDRMNKEAEKVQKEEGLFPEQQAAQLTQMGGRLEDFEQEAALGAAQMPPQQTTTTSIAPQPTAPPMVAPAPSQGFPATTTSVPSTAEQYMQSMIPQDLLTQLYGPKEPIPPSIAQPPNPYIDYLKQLGGQTMRTAEQIGQVYPVVEAGLSTVTGLSSFVPQWIARVAGGAEKGPKWAENVSRLMTYQPITQQGQEFTQRLNYPFELIGEAENALVDLSIAYPEVFQTIYETILGKPKPIGGKVGQSIQGLPDSRQLNPAEVEHAVRVAFQGGMILAPFVKKGVPPALRTEQLSALKRVGDALDKIDSPGAKQAKEVVQGVAQVVKNPEAAKKVVEQGKAAPPAPTTPSTAAEAVPSPVSAAPTKLPADVALEILQEADPNIPLRMEANKIEYYDGKNWKKAWDVDSEGNVVLEGREVAVTKKPGAAPSPANKAPLKSITEQELQQFKKEAGEAGKAQAIKEQEARAKEEAKPVSEQVSEEIAKAHHTFKSYLDELARDKALGNISNDVYEKKLKAAKEWYAEKKSAPPAAEAPKPTEVIPAQIEAWAKEAGAVYKGEGKSAKGEPLVTIHDPKTGSTNQAPISKFDSKEKIQKWLAEKSDVFIKDSQDYINKWAPDVELVEISNNGQKWKLRHKKSGAEGEVDIPEMAYLKDKEAIIKKWEADNASEAAAPAEKPAVAEPQKSQAAIDAAEEIKDIEKSGATGAAIESEVYNRYKNRNKEITALVEKGTINEDTAKGFREQSKTQYDESIKILEGRGKEEVKAPAAPKGVSKGLWDEYQRRGNLILDKLNKKEITAEKAVELEQMNREWFQAARRAGKNESIMAMLEELPAINRENIKKGIDTFLTRYNDYLDGKGIRPDLPPGLTLRQGNALREYVRKNRTKTFAYPTKTKVKPPATIPTPGELISQHKEYLTPNVPIAEMIKQHGDFAVTVKDYNGHRATMDASQFLELMKNRAFNDRVKQVWIQKETPHGKLDMQEGFMASIIDKGGKMLTEPAQKETVAEIKGVKLTNNSTVTPTQKVKFVNMVKNERVRTLLQERGIKEVIIEPPYKFSLSEEANIIPKEKIIRINADASDPVNSILHELGHDKLLSLPKSIQDALKDKVKDVKGAEGYLSAGYPDEAVANFLYTNKEMELFMEDLIKRYEAEGVSTKKVKVESAADYMKNNPKAEGYFKPDYPLDEMLAKHGDFTVQVFDIKGMPAQMNLSDFLRLKTNPKFRGQVRAVKIHDVKALPENERISRITKFFAQGFKKNVGLEILKIEKKEQQQSNLVKPKKKAKEKAEVAEVGTVLKIKGNDRDLLIEALAEQQVKAFENKDEYTKSWDKFSKDGTIERPFDIEVNFEGTTYTIANRTENIEGLINALGQYQKQVRTKTKHGPKPYKPSTSAFRRPWFDKNGDLLPGEHYIWAHEAKAKIALVPESSIYTADITIYGTIGKEKFYGTGKIIEFQDKPPVSRARLEEIAQEGIDKISNYVNYKKWEKAKSNFETEKGAIIHTKDRGLAIPHDYYDYIVSKYGDKVEWWLPDEIDIWGVTDKTQLNTPIKFTVEGKTKGFVAPLGKEFTGTLADMLKPYEGGPSYPYLEMAFPFPSRQLEAMYDGVKSYLKDINPADSIFHGAVKTKDYIKELVNSWRFYPNLPKEYVNDVRLHVVAALDKSRQKVYSKEGVAGRIFGDMKRKEIEEVVKLIYARDEVGRQKAGKGNPEITEEQAFSTKESLENAASPEVLRAADEYSAVMEAYRQSLVERGAMDEGQFIEDYAPHQVSVYTPEWANLVGIPVRMKNPFRSYTRKAKGTIKEINKDVDVLLGTALKIEHHNMIDDFIVRETMKYDMRPQISRQQKLDLFGYSERTRINAEGEELTYQVVKTPKPGTIFTEQELVSKLGPDWEGAGNYRAWSPDSPFSRKMYPGPEGEMILGGYKHVSVIPEWLYNSFKSFSEPGNKHIYIVNMANAYWKNLAILSHYPAFNINNMLGDTFMAMVQHPEPMKLLSEYTTALNYITKVAKDQPLTGYLKELDKFINDQAILEASFFQTEMPRQIGKAKNPFTYLLDKTMTVSQMREAINRTAYASTLLRAKQQGRGIELAKAHDWINTKALLDAQKVEEALGQIAREVLVDYAATSKSFRRYGRGLLFPFGTWPFKASVLMNKWMLKHPGKAAVGFMTLPVAAAYYNSSSEEKRQMELRQPDWVRGTIHWNLSEDPDGGVNTFVMQAPQDALIGTKIFTIATNYANRVYNKEINPLTNRPWTAKEAAIRTLRDWGIKEARGITFQFFPLMRYFLGITTGVDPYDKSPVYSTDRRRMNFSQEAREAWWYFVKTAVPMLGADLVKTYQQKKPADIMWKKALEPFVGKEALGIYKITPKGGYKMANGVEITMDTQARVRWWSGQLTPHFDDIQRKFIDYNGKTSDFFKDNPKLNPTLIKMYDVLSNLSPRIFPADRSDDFKAKRAKSAFAGTLFNIVNSPKSNQLRQEVMMERAKTDEEKRAIREDWEKWRDRRAMEAFMATAKTERMLMYDNQLRESDIPWWVLLTSP